MLCLVDVPGEMEEQGVDLRGGQVGKRDWAVAREEKLQLECYI